MAYFDRQSKKWWFGVFGGWLVVAVVAAGVLVVEYVNSGPPGLQLYRAMMNGTLWTPHKHSMSITPREITLRIRRSSATGIQCHVESYSLVFPRGGWRGVLSWYRTGDSMPLRAIQNVLFSEQQGIHGPHTIKRAKFLSFVELRPYLRPPKGTIEIGDGRSGNFLVPTEVKSVTVQIKPMFRHRPICAIGDNFPHFQMSWVPVAKWSDPRDSFKEILSGVWPVKSLTKPLCRILTSCGVSSSKATKLIDETIRQHLAKQTDLQLLRNTLMADAAELRHQRSVRQALWTALELEWFVYDKHGPVVWVHLNSGQTMCFLIERDGAGIWVFDAAGGATSEGYISSFEFNGNINHWTNSQWIRTIKTVAVPFFSQQAPLSFAHRGRQAGERSSYHVP